MNAADIRDLFRRLLRRARPSRGEPAEPRARGRRQRPLHDRRDAAVQAVLPGRGDAAGHAHHHLPALVPHVGRRERRQDRASPHLLRDAGQLLVRRLLQGRGRRVGAGALGPAGHRPRQGLGERLRRRRPGARRRGGRRAVEVARLHRGPHRPPGARRQLLGARRAHRAVRALLGAVLRLRPGDGLRRPGLQAGLRLRPLPRVLEPRLRAVRHGRGRRPHAAPQGQHRHRHGPRAHLEHHAGRHQRLRDRPVRAAGGAGRGARRREARCLAGRHPRLAHHGGARPRRRVPRHGRGAAGQRRARLRAAPHHPPRRAAGRGHRRRQAVPEHADRRRRRPDGRRLSRARGRAARDPPRDQRRGGPLPPHARPGHGHPRGGPAARPRRRHGASRRGGLRAARHLRVPLRPHARDRRRAGHDRRRGALRAPHGRAARSRPRRPEGGRVRLRTGRGRGLPASHHGGPLRLRRLRAPRGLHRRARLRRAR